MIHIAYINLPNTLSMLYLSEMYKLTDKSTTINNNTKEAVWRNFFSAGDTDLAYLRHFSTGAQLRDLK